MRARLLFLACLACFAWGCAEAQHPGDESSSADDLPRNTHHRTKKKKKKVAHKTHRDDDDDDAPKKKAKKSSDDDDEDAPKKPVKKVAAKKDDDDDDAPKKPVKKAVAKKDDDDEDAPKKPVKKAVAKKDDDDEDAPKKPVKKVVAKKNPHSESPDEDEDAPKKPIKKVVAKKDDDDEDAPKKPVKKVAAKKPADDDEDAPKKAPPIAKHTVEDEPKITDDEDEAPAKPKPVAVKAPPKPKPKSDDDEVVAKRPATKPSDEDKPKPEDPPKKQRSIEEDVAIDDPLATAPPPRTASADEGGEDAAETGTTSDAVVVAPNPSPPLQDRPLTTPVGQLDLHAGLPINVLTLTDAAGISSSSTSEGFALGVAYGFNAKGEVGLDYTLGLNPGTLEGPATLHGAYSFARGKLDFAAAAALGIDFYDTIDSMTMATSSKTAASFQLGAWVRYHATPTVSIFSGLPAMPNASASLSKLAFALPLVSYQIQIGLSDRGTSAVTLPIGLGYQASPKLYAFASLNLANIRIANTANAFLFKDYIPIAVGGFYNLDTFSLGASLADDLKQGLGYLRFELVARYLLH